MLNRLQDEIKSIKVSQSFLTGDFSANEIEVGDNLLFGYVDYDQSLGHHPVDIDLVESYVSDRYQVPVSAARKNFNLSVINALSLSNEKPGNIIGQDLLANINEKRFSVASGIANLLGDLRIGSIGHPKMFDSSDLDRELNDEHLIIIDGPKFENVDSLIVHSSKPIIGIRVLHLLDVKVPSNIGVLQTGDISIPHLDTTKNKQLLEYNKKLEDKEFDRRKTITERWGEDLRLVDVIYDPLNKGYVDKLDDDLATVVGQVW